MTVSLYGTEKDKETVGGWMWEVPLAPPTAAAAATAALGSYGTFRRWSLAGRHKSLQGGL